VTLRAIGVAWLMGVGGLAAQAPAPGVQAPDFRLAALMGDTVRLSSLRGRAVLLNFWATWCDPCRSEMPAIAAASAQYRDSGLAVLGVNLRDQERRRAVERFVKEFDLPFPVLLDASGKVRRLYHLRAVPTTVFVDTGGVVRRIHPGPLTAETLAQGLRDILPRP